MWAPCLYLLEQQSSLRRKPAEAALFFSPCAGGQSQLWSQSGPQSVLGSYTGDSQPAAYTLPLAS